MSTNRSYNPTGQPAFNSLGASGQIRNEFLKVGAGFTEIESEINRLGSGNVVVSAEWVNQGRTAAFYSSTQLVIAGVDLTNVMVQYRRLRLTIGGVYVYTEVVSSLYADGGTTVTVLDAIITTDLTLAEYSAITPYQADSSSLSYNQLLLIVGASSLAPPTLIDTTAGNVVKTMPATGNHFSYIKKTADANQVSFITSDGSTFAENSGSPTTCAIVLDVQNKRITFDKVGTVWYR
jgi:hypothetical protein